jgi:FMN-dependent oxidoreductase (nitrilotriacetate monooxygenase family)
VPASDGKMRLAAVLPVSGQHMGAWRHPEGTPEATIDVRVYHELAHIAERGKFDFIFVADSLGIPDWPLDVVCRSGFMTFVLDPLTMMANIAATTTNIGFVVTSSSTYWHPYQIARVIASLNLVSHGRAGWNIVTSLSDTEAALFGLDEQIPHDDRYVRATEFVDVVKRLWNTNERELYVGDKASGVLFDSTKLSPLDFQGEFFKVTGVLNVPQPYGPPILVQAGASGPGRQLAASVADVIFASAPTIDLALEYANDIRRRAAEAGRPENSTLILPGFVPVIGTSEAHAQEKSAELDALLDEQVAIGLLSHIVDVDLTGYDLDVAFPDFSAQSNRSQSSATHLYQMAQPENLTIRQVAERCAVGLTHTRVSGTPTQVADYMEEWFTRGACDGFLFAPMLTPSHLTEFVNLVVPELQRRGLFRTEYEAATLRGNLGLGLASGRW